MSAAVKAACLVVLKAAEKVERTAGVQAAERVEM